MRLRFAEISAMDRSIGRMRQALRELNVSDNTLLWFNSDNGIPVAKEEDSFNGGWRGHKGDVYEGGLRVPAIIEWPSVIHQPRRSDVACVTSDILPTLLDLLNIKHPKPDRPLDGISLKALIVDDSMKVRPTPIGFWKYPSAGESKNDRWVSKERSTGTTPTTKKDNILFENFKHPMARTGNFGGEAAWTDSQYKLVVTTGKNKTSKTQSAMYLYDLQADPQESHDLAADRADLVDKMRDQLEGWQRSVERSLSGADY